MLWARRRVVIILICPNKACSEFRVYRTIEEVIVARLQSSVLAPVPPVGRFLSFVWSSSVAPSALREHMSALAHHDDVIGLGHGATQRLGIDVPGLHPFPSTDAPSGSMPSTQADVLVFLRGDDAGALLLRARRWAAMEGLVLQEDVATFRYASGRDLSGYEDGTENPEARGLEVVSSPSAPFGCFVAVQRWVHHLDVMAAMGVDEADQVIGRHHATNEELDDSPSSAHVRRAAQEGFEPGAWMIRRSMPWGDVRAHGLVFVSFAGSLQPFEAVWRRMTGVDDGVVDGLFRFTRPVTGAFYWCPPVGDDGALALG